MRKILLALLLSIKLSGFAQDGSVDTSFNPPRGVRNGDVNASATQSDGKIIVGGTFTLLNNVDSNKLARLNADGSIDLTFSTGTGFNNTVNGIATQSDGKILVVGDFTTYNGVSKNRIVRLNTDGSIDSSFNTGTGSNDNVSAVTLQADGKILVTGRFTSFNGSSKNRIVRLNTDGTVDSTFNLTTGANNIINSCVVQSDGKILIAGYFSSFNGVVRNRIARLNTDGSVDTAFTSGTAFNNYVKTLCLQSDGKIIVGGNFTSYNGTAVNYIARLNPDSTIDAAFNTGTGFNASVNCINIQADGKVVVGGNFYSFNTATYCMRIARLNSDGSADSTFGSIDSSFGTDSAVNVVTIQSNGKIMLGGSFSYYNNFSRNRIASLNANGTIDTGFYPFLENGLSTNGAIEQIALQPDGKILISGAFSTYRSIPAKGFARLNSDGTLDTTFNVGTGVDNLINKIALTSNNKIIIAGNFKTYNGVTCNGIARLNADGSLDTAFNAGGSGANNRVNTLSLQSDGKIIIGGTFSTFNGTSRNLLARLNANGTVDTSFIPKLTQGNIWTISIQADGKIIIAGLLLQYNYNSTGEILRLNTDGSLDTTFNLGGSGTDYFVYCSAVQADGKIILGGSFSKFNNIASKGVVRLNADGSLDTSFIVPALYGSVVMQDIAIQNDGKIIVGGSFNSFSAAVGNSIMRLNTDGTLDPAFATGTGFAYISALAIQNDGKILVGGNYVAHNNNADIQYIARLHNSNSLGLGTDYFNHDFKVNVYPNPVADYLKFSTPDGMNISGFEVFDITGKKIDSNILNTDSIDVTRYMQGMYFLRLKTDNGVFNAKFIKN
ncbi:T9SS type A sorting domain-containing protein [Flavobacterium hungaricum]|uniref:T9SS C-terminal target domain-containing protein n=1 Tax=Flavobacterium hungaricum TaxID=2082725 RepID=A0ABR9TM18_9FLAO|nr:T9SS type A sorting domain-containing protein [Flavobacterium hungaricum]MBE8726355.1 T9SS C-terminal target domain-containing protein [Flavobacterium hungaricum]